MTRVTQGDGAITGLDACVHCGFCLQACPTFVATGDEADSPRGRIVLMQALAHGEFQADNHQLISHIDRCLGCRACETACPSGVEYGRALEATRSKIQQTKPLRGDAVAVLTIMAQPVLRRIIFTFAKLLRPLARFFSGGSTIGFGMGMLAATAPANYPRGTRVSATQPSLRAASNDTVVVFKGCIMDGLFDHVNRATANVLAHNEYALVNVATQGCCGALHAHAGRAEEARSLALENINAFEHAPQAAIAINSAGCGAALKEYGHWFADTPHAERAAIFSARVHDVTELLSQVGPKKGATLNLSVAYDPPCHLLHAQRVQDEPFSVLHAVPGLDITQHQGADDCCGSAGLYSMLERRMSRDVLKPKIEALRITGPDVVATGNPGCIMQIGAGLRACGVTVPVVHPVEILDWSYQRLADNRS